MNAATSKARLNQTAVAFCAFVVAFQLSLFLIAVFAAPNCLTILLHETDLVISIIAGISWEYIGFVWLLNRQPRTRRQGITQCAIVLGFCVLPLIVLPLIGPTLKTIVQTCSPLF